METTRASKPTADRDVIEQIDDVVAGEEPAGEKDPMEAALRLALPSHAYFTEIRPEPPGFLRNLAAMTGATVTEVGASLRGIDAQWSTPRGVWRVLAGPSPDGNGGYLVTVKGPGFEWDPEDEVSIESTLALLGLTGGIG